MKYTLRYTYFILAVIFMGSCSVDDLPAPESPSKSEYTEAPGSLSNNVIKWTYTPYDNTPQETFTRSPHTSSFPIINTEFGNNLELVNQEFGPSGDPDYLNISTSLNAFPSSGNSQDLLQNNYTIRLSKDGVYETFYSGDPDVLSFYVSFDEVDESRDLISGIVYIESFNNNRAVGHQLEFSVSVAPEGYQVFR